MKSTSLLIILSIFSSTAVAGLEKRDGSTITVSTTQFNPAITNQGGTTNAAGTFNVSPLATSTSYQFKSVSQTSTFVIGPVATGSSNSGSNNGGSNNGGNSGGSGNVGGGTVVVTATAPTTTISMAGTTSASGTGEGSGIVTASNGLPSLTLGSTNAAVAMSTNGMVMAAMTGVLIGAINIL